MLVKFPIGMLHWNRWNGQSQSHIATDGQSVSKSWCRAPSGAHDQIFNPVWQLWSCFCGAPSLMRGRVCLLYMLLALASAVFLRSKSLGTRNHILLPQIWDFPFCRLLRLACLSLTELDYSLLSRSPEPDIAHLAARFTFPSQRVGYLRSS
jgi:hypothetical protein